MQLVIPLSRNSGPLFRQVYAGLRSAILEGTLRPEEQLPSTRDLADQLGVSRTVVLVAYEQLLAEGYVTGRGGSGTYVAPALSRESPQKMGAATLRLSRFGAAAMGAGAAVNSPQRRVALPRYDFVFGRSDIEIFPFAAWRRLLLKQARDASSRQLDYGAATGNAQLREEICLHLRRSRAVVCDPEDVIVVNGSQQALDLVARVLVERGDRVVVEEPHYNGIRETLRAAGAKLIPVTVDRDGIETDGLPKQARAVFVTPSHQFPTGALLSLQRRFALLEWARRCNAVIVEDDYDGEFHYAGRPLESLQSLDRDGRIVYIGTFSRTVFPSLRIGYLIAPKSLVAAFTAAKWLNDLHSATLEQQTLAAFMASGMYERHLRRMRRGYASRRAAMVEAVVKHFGESVEMTGENAGAHVVLWPKKKVEEQEVIAAASAHGVSVYGSAHCYLGKPPRAGFMLGYARLSEREIGEGVKLFAEVLR